MMRTANAKGGRIERVAIRRCKTPFYWLPAGRGIRIDRTDMEDCCLAAVVYGRTHMLRGMVMRRSNYMVMVDLVVRRGRDLLWRCMLRLYPRGGTKGRQDGGRNTLARI
jgi:hypothetical protein